MFDYHVNVYFNALILHLSKLNTYNTPESSYCPIPKVGGTAIINAVPATRIWRLEKKDSCVIDVHFVSNSTSILYRMVDNSTSE